MFVLEPFHLSRLSPDTAPSSLGLIRGSSSPANSFLSWKLISTSGPSTFAASGEADPGGESGILSQTKPSVIRLVTAQLRLKLLLSICPCEQMPSAWMNERISFGELVVGVVRVPVLFPLLHPCPPFRKAIASTSLSNDRKGKEYECPNLTRPSS